ncbi:LOW QUALITY PROTEIN: mucin-2 [Drosophila tropicalis]|uniref:LOW QUALITY PROTEIN: mucin-2 n=1 Tax=Drosophila tropicalis TaxID=46794 RepID=UPI0035AB6BF1
MLQLRRRATSTTADMEFSTQRMSLFWMVGLCLLLSQIEIVTAQSKRSSRITSSRSFGTNVKPTSSSGISFDCPEEFGYYPHPTDCTQYYVCVFGGALLESCTGGLMYSHELQTCDWPRNVGCEVVDTSTERGTAHAQTQQHVPSRVRFGAAFSSPGAAPTSKAPTVPPQYHRSPPQIIQAQVEHIPPPPELRVPPNPVVTSRGQPKLVDSQEDIAKLYAEAQETLPPIEEEESDRQQRVYRGQPSTVNQVQRDRDGILQQASLNAIPQSGKIGSYAFGTAYRESLNEDVTNKLELSHNRLRKRRDVSSPSEELTTPRNINQAAETFSNSSRELIYSERLRTLSNADDSIKSLNQHEDEDEPVSIEIKPIKFSSKIAKTDVSNNRAMDFKYVDSDEDKDVKGDDASMEGDVATGESKRRPRQLRHPGHESVNWPGQQPGNNYRSVDPQSYPQQNAFSFGNFNPYLTPPSNTHNYNQQNPGYQGYQQQQIPSLYQKPKLVYTGYNLSLPPPPLEDDFRPIAGNYYGAASLVSSTSRTPTLQGNRGDLLPYLIQQLRELKERRKHLQTENFAYFHLDNQRVAPKPATTAQTPFDFYPSTSHPNNQAHFSTMGGFYNNQAGKLISHYSIGTSAEQKSTTESNYFQYNIIANQKMKGVYTTSAPNQIGHVPVKVRPPVTPLQVTPNIDIVSAPNLAYNKPNTLQQVPFREFSHLPVGITYADNITLPESYQTFTKSISSTAVPTSPSTTSKPLTANFQFNINEFMKNLKASDIASVNPAINPLIRYFKQVSSDGNNNVKNALVIRRPLNNSTKSGPQPQRVNSKPIPIGPTSAAPLKAKPKPTVASFSTPTTTQALKGYESFIKGIQKQIDIQNTRSTALTPTTTKTTPTKINTSTLKNIDYYDEDYEEDIEILPPSKMPPYMPMSETMAPPRQQLPTATPTLVKPGVSHPNFQTGFMEATTTRRPFHNFSRFNSSSSGIGVPSIITFPSDIFQELKHRLPLLHESTSSPPIFENNRPTLNATVTSMTAAPIRGRYTVRPQRQRGQQKWTVTPSVDPIIDNTTERSKTESNSLQGNGKQSSLGGLQLNSIHVNLSSERHRVESSSPSSGLGTPTSANIFVQPTPQGQVALLASNRNSYNASSTIFNQGSGYQLQQPQQQPTPFQQPQQQKQHQHQPEQQAQTVPNPYDPSYYSVYDDDIDLYRDIEYQQQQQQQHQQKEPSPPPVAYQPALRPQQSQSTYRPLEQFASPTPSQKPSYNNEPTLRYSTDYDEDLNAQIEHENAYDQPTRTPQRPKQVTIQRLEARTTPTTTARPDYDARNYYSTLTTPRPSAEFEEADYSYSSSAEYIYGLSEDYLQSERTPVKTKPSLDSDNDNIIANIVDSTNKLNTTPPTFTQSTSVASRSTTKSSTAPPTVKVTRPPSKTTTPTPPPPTSTSKLSSSKTHEKKYYSVINKFKSSNVPGPSTSNTTVPPTHKTPTSVPTSYNTNPFLKSKLQTLAKSLVSFVSSNQSRADIVNSSSVLPLTNKQLVKSVNNINASRIENIETISDESQFVHVQTAEAPTSRSRSFETSTSPRFLDFINAAAYGTSPKGNLVQGPSENLEYANKNVLKYANSSELIPVVKGNKRIQNFVQSDIAPQSFKVSRDRSTPIEIIDSSSTTRTNNDYPASVQLGLYTGYRLSAEKPEKENGLLSDYAEVTSTQAPPVSTTIDSETFVNIVPTTYAPPLRVWRNGRPTIQQQTIKSTTPITVPTTPEKFSVTTKPSVFTARASNFKDTLNRVTANPAMRFVSPYKSLENLLHEERQSPHRSRYMAPHGSASVPLMQTTHKPLKSFSTIAGIARNFSVSDLILSTISPQTTTQIVPRSTTPLNPTPSSTSIQEPQPLANQRGRSRFTAATFDSIDEPTTYAPKFKPTNNFVLSSPTVTLHPKRKAQRIRVINNKRQLKATAASKPEKRFEIKPSENEATIDSDAPRAEALVAERSLEAKQDNSIELSTVADDASSSTEQGADIGDRSSVKFLYSNKYRQQMAERTLADSLQNAGYITAVSGRNHKFRTANVLEQLQQFLSGSGSDSNESGSSQFVNEFSVPEIRAAVDEIKQLYIPTTTTTLRPSTYSPSPSQPTRPSSKLIPNQSKPHFTSSTLNVLVTDPIPTPTSTLSTSNITTVKIPPIITTTTISTTILPNVFAPATTRASRVNNVIKSSIAAAAVHPSSSLPTTFPSNQLQKPAVRANKFQYGFTTANNNNYQLSNNNSHNKNVAPTSANAAASASVKCSDSILSPKCNEIPSRNSNRNRGSSTYSQDRDAVPVSTPNRGTHPPRTRPTLKPSGTIVSKAQEFVDIYRYPPTRPDPLYPQPTPDKTAAKCRKDVCLLPDCYCGGKDIPGELPVENIPQIVLLTFDDSVNDLNKQLYTDLFEKGRVNPNGCPITATFYVSHEWTDYSQVQNLYSDGHEMASHTVSHSFGEQFSQKKWTREIAGQREILAAYGGVKLSDVRGMRAPFLSVGGNKMYKMLYDSNFTYDSSMPVYENRPPSWPYTLDYKIFHDCMIPPCPTRSYPGVWQVPMVMWQDLNGGRCSMGDACSNPSDADGVTKMIMKNFERHYTTNRAPFGLFYHAAWFTQPHHKEGFIKFLDAINAMPDVWIITNWQALQWVRDPTPTSRINSFQPFQCDYSDRPKRCNNPKVCNLWHKSGVRYMKTCQPCPDIYPWTGKSGIRSSRIDNDAEETAT